MLNCDIKKFIFVISLSIVVVILAFSISIDNLFVNAATKDLVLSSSNQGKVFVMYAGSLLKTFTDSIGPLFQKEIGYTYEGEARGSVQVANMIIDGQRKPDVFVTLCTLAFT